MEVIWRGIFLLLRRFLVNSEAFPAVLGGALPALPELIGLKVLKRDVEIQILKEESNGELEVSSSTQQRVRDDFSFFASAQNDYHPTLQQMRKKEIYVYIHT